MSKPRKYSTTLSDPALARVAVREALEHALDQKEYKDVPALARLFAELNGQLGKHSRAPTDANAPLHEQSRADLEQLAN
jgi:hypothetical protein